MAIDNILTVVSYLECTSHYCFKIYHHIGVLASERQSTEEVDSITEQVHVEITQFQ